MVQNKETLLMRIAKRALSRELIMPFLDENERDVPEENEDAADDAIDRCTNMLLALKENTFVKKKPNFCNLPNLVRIYPTCLRDHPNKRVNRRV
jgi:hypothetical protein